MTATRSVLIGMLLLFSISFLRCSGAAYGDQEPHPQTEMEEFRSHLAAMHRLVCGSEPREFPSEPWTDHALNEYLQQFTTRRIGRIKSPFTSQVTEPYALLLNGNVAVLARARLAIRTKSPMQGAKEDSLAFYDSQITRQQVILSDLLLGLETLERYQEFSQTESLALDVTVQRQLTKQLGELERSVRERLLVGRAMYARHLLDHPPKDVQRDIVEQRLTRLMRALCCDELAAEIPNLRKRADELEAKIQQDPVAGTAVAAYLESLQQHYKSLVERNRESAKRRLGSVERSDMERSRARAAAELSSYVGFLMERRIESIQLCVLQNHTRRYSGVGYSFDGEITLPTNHLSLANYFEKRATCEIASVRSFLKAFEEKALSEGFVEHLEDWWVKRGRQLPLTLLDALIDDFTQWMEGLPSTRQIAKKELLRILGFPESKSRIADLTDEEELRVQFLMRRSIRDITRAFDRDKIYFIRQDLDTLESLLKSYPTRELVLVEKSSWLEKPEGRIRIQDCKGLTEAAAVEAYRCLFQQLADDCSAFADEHRRYVVAVDLNITMHLRAGEGR